MSNSLDPDQARRSVGPDLGPNCFQKLSADNTIRQSDIDFLWPDSHVFDNNQIINLYHQYSNRTSAANHD